MKPRRLILLPIVLGIIGILFSFTIPGTFQCMGTADCFSGKVTEIVDGHTIKIDGQSVRLALVSSPEIYENNGLESAEFIENICPLDSVVLVDEDDEQQEGSYGILIGVVYCNGQNLNHALLESGFGTISKDFCDFSEFSETQWATKFGC